MTWHLTFFQNKQAWLDKDGILVDKTCYSGSPEGKNDVSKEALHDVGPIPRGEWIISGPPFDSLDHGPYVLRLDPAKGTDTFGRSGFLIHGDSIAHPGEASKGCLIVPRVTRERLYQSGDTQLMVLAEEEKEES